MRRPHRPGRTAPAGPWLFVALLSALSFVCAAQTEPRLAVSQFELAAGEENSRFRVAIDLALAEPVVEALNNGVPIIFRWELALTDRGVLGLGRRLWETGGTLRLAYRPLSRRYSLADDVADTERSFPDLPRLIEAVSELDQSLPPLARVVAAGRVVRARFRIRLEIAALPPALRLPSYLDEAWRMDSGWTTRPVSSVQPEPVDGGDSPDAR